MNEFGMQSLEDTPCENTGSENDSLRRRRLLLDALDNLRSKFVNLDVVFLEDIPVDKQQPTDTAH